MHDPCFDGSFLALLNLEGFLTFKNILVRWVVGMYIHLKWKTWPLSSLGRSHAQKNDNKSSFPTLQVRTCEPLVSGREIILMPLCLVHFVQFQKKHRNLVVNFHGYSWTLKTGFPWLVLASKIGHSYWAADVSKRNPNQLACLNKQNKWQNMEIQ